MTLRLPPRFDSRSANVRVGGKPVKVVVREKVLHFEVAITQRDGYKAFVLEFGK